MYYDCYIIAFFNYVYTYFFMNIIPIPDHFRISLQWTFNIVFIMFIHSSFFFESEIKENGKKLIGDLMRIAHLCELFCKALCWMAFYRSF